jgi:hypothetical protein
MDGEERGELGAERLDLGVVGGASGAGQIPLERQAGEIGHRGGVIGAEAGGWCGLVQRGQQVHGRRIERLFQRRVALQDPGKKIVSEIFQQQQAARFVRGQDRGCG